MSTMVHEYERATLYGRLKYTDLDLRQLQGGLPALCERDWTYEEWSLQIESLARLLRTNGGRPTVDELAVIHSNVTALMIAVERAETADIAAGEDEQEAA